MGPQPKVSLFHEVGKDMPVSALTDESLAGLLESFADPALLVDGEHFHVVAWNDGALQLGGSADLQGRAVSDLFYAEGTHASVVEWLRGAQAGGSNAFDRWSIGGVGQKVRLIAHALNRGASQAYLLVIHRDTDVGEKEKFISAPHIDSPHIDLKTGDGVDDRKQDHRALESRLAESEATFHTLMETTPAAVFIFQDRKIVFA